MTGYEILRDSLLKIRLDEDLRLVNEDLEANKPTEAEEGKKLGFFKKVGNSFKNSNTESLNKDKLEITDQIERFARSHNEKELISKDDVYNKFEELFANDKVGCAKTLFYCAIASNQGYKFFYENQGYKTIESLLKIGSDDIVKAKNSLVSKYRELTKNGLFNFGDKISDELSKKLDIAIIAILNEKHIDFISRFVLESGSYKLELNAKKYPVDESKFSAEELSIAYALILVLLELHKNYDSKETRKELLGYIVKQECALVSDVKYNYLVTSPNDEQAKSKYNVLNNFENYIVKNIVK